MYVPAGFASDDLARLDALVGRDPFVTLVTVDGEGMPFASHLPVLYRRDDAGIVLEGHWARPNPQWRHAGTALAIVHGPHAYVSAGWYPDKASAGRVPTWNYEAAHLRGTLETFDDADALAAVVDALSRVHEARTGGDWGFDRDDIRQTRMLAGIVGFRLRVAQVQIKRKLGQNHPRANMAAVIDRLQARGGREAEVAAAMAQLLPAPDDTRR